MYTIDIAYRMLTYRYVCGPVATADMPMLASNFPRYGYRYINLVAVRTQGRKDDSLKHQPQASGAPSLAGIGVGGGVYGVEGGRGLAGCSLACSLAAWRPPPFSLSRSRHL